MYEPQDIQQMRLKLYEEVWSEPMTTVAVRYGISDNGLRKRCKALNIPLPPVGYWAKVKAGKPVPEQVPLPPTIYNSNNADKSDGSKPQAQKKDSILRFVDTEEFSLEQLSNMQDFDLLLPGSFEDFSNWYSNIKVPGRIQDYHALVSKHQSEREYREARDKEHPFRDKGIKIWSPVEKVKYRDNEAVIPISVSSRQYNRACRIADTILKSFQELEARFSVERGNQDNITITLLSSDLSFEIFEHKTKRRYLSEQGVLQDLRPIYEEVYDGRLQINWTVHKAGYYSTDKSASTILSYSDSDEERLEDQIPSVVLEVCKLCFNNEIINRVEQKKRAIQFEIERKKRIEKENIERQRNLEEKRQAQIDSLINELPNHANNWFKRNQLLRYADELENFLVTCQEQETIQLLQIYIQLVRENADIYNPLSNILDKMRTIELLESS
ncbi:hypothetical protein [Desulforamulus ruminis]|uniref:Uncharacterized protein n=1 Tax=Desulforamulus ruminis (strain ATCC 23193 / DSM 2154 / NCIMB 8452 / DL) TaxID=696281 RepID=F6DMG9_DESRL|nr:hypothetical protein [Desulforamulus ruminis]AEG61730.1 hypothetical protein Desru_3527 [Desulforamulus ruminis DSM 2154]